MKTLFSTAAFAGLLSLVLGGCGGGDASPDYRSIAVERGSISKVAVAVGNIEPRHEAAIKSRTGGVLTRLFVTLGQKVKKGDPLAEVRPVLTDLDILNAERSLVSARDGLEAAQEFQSGAHIMSRVMRLMQGQNNLNRMQRGAEQGYESAEQSLQLLRDGKVSIDGKEIDFIVRAPLDGTVIEIAAREGAPVVPSSNFGSGTVLVRLADMDRPLFLGTVAEIDVGRLEAGMTAAVRIGALPGQTLTGKVTEVGLRARRRDNAVTFAVRIDVQPPEHLTIRAGFSAVADIVVARREDVLVVPERAVRFRDGEPYVLMRGPSGDVIERTVDTGLSDGLTVEVMSGLAAGDEVLERVYGAGS